MKPKIMTITPTQIEVCVPEFWPDELIARFAENGQQINPENIIKRTPCIDRRGFVHVVLMIDEK